MSNAACVPQNKVPRELAVTLTDLPSCILQTFPSEKQKKACQQPVLHIRLLSATLIFYTCLAQIIGKAGNCVGHQPTEDSNVTVVLLLLCGCQGSGNNSGYC